MRDSVSSVSGAAILLDQEHWVRGLLRWRTRPGGLGEIGGCSQGDGGIIIAWSKVAPRFEGAALGSRTGKAARVARGVERSGSVGRVTKAEDRHNGNKQNSISMLYR
jgi:hypothetical protein